MGPRSSQAEGRHWRGWPAPLQLSQAWLLQACNPDQRGQIARSEISLAGCWEAGGIVARTLPATLRQ